MPYIAALPPISRFVTFTSIKDEYLKIGQRKIKTENLILKIRNYPQGSVWVAKSDRALIKIELPSRGITFTRSFKSASITCEASSLQDPRYLTRDLSIKSAGAELAGRLTVPTNGSRFPAVLLIGGSYPGSADCGGLFEKIADLLSKDGYMVLRFDRRGIGLSKGESSSVTLNDDESDDAAALAHLKQLPSVDPDRIFMIGHAEGALSAMKLSSSDPQVKGVILLAAAAPPGRGPGNAAEGIGRIAAKAGWPDEYIELVKRAVRSTRDIADDANGDWGTVLGRKVFVRSAREEPPDIRSIASNLKAPVLILQGRKALELSPESSGELEQVFISAGNQKHTLKYYPDLGYFFGSVINDGIHKIRYETDGMVLRDIKEWLDRRLAENPPGEVVRATDNHVKPAFPAMRDSEPKRSEAAGPAG
jgi:pimeloyl-ACP methyl ester carboxylesterase